MVPHMNELEDKFGPRGLSIVGVTSEGEKETTKWVQGKHAKYAYAYDKSGALASAFGVRGIPHAVLVDVNGTVLWSGHPGQLDEALLEKAVSGALKKPLWELGKDEAGVRKALLADDLAQAAKAAEAAGPESAELVRAWIDSRVAAVESAVERGDYRVAVTVGDRAAKALAGLPEADKVAALVDGVRKDPERKALLRAQETLGELETAALSAQGRKKTAEIAAKLEKLAADHPGTSVAERATEVANDLKRRK